MHACVCHVLHVCTSTSQGNEVETSHQPSDKLYATFVATTTANATAKVDGEDEDEAEAERDVGERKTEKWQYIIHMFVQWAAGERGRRSVYCCTQKIFIHIC